MTTPAGVCRFCGCSDWDGCVLDDQRPPITCCWTDRAQSVCSACAPAARAEAIILRTLARAGYRSTGPRLSDNLDFVDAVHQGFIVGWFGISPRRPAGRNPWPPMRRWAKKHDAWDRGQRAGLDASRQYQRVCGPLMNTPRPDVLHERRRRSGSARKDSGASASVTLPHRKSGVTR